MLVLFYNLGGYHLARLRAAERVFQSRGWKLQAVQIAGTTAEHPWGEITLPTYVTTLLPQQDGRDPSIGKPALLTECLERLSPDCVAIPGWGFDFARTAFQWCRRRKVPTILMSESKVDDSPRVWWKESIKSWLHVRRYDASLVGGSKHRAYLERLGMAPDRIFGGYDVVDHDWFVSETDSWRQTTNATARPECQRGRPTVIAVNRFIPRKNVARLISAFARLKSNDSDWAEWQLVLLGGGPEQAALEKQVRSEGVADTVHFPGFASYAEIARWYAFAEIFVHPALSEQWGLVVNEAMAAGLPVLLSQACGCHPDLMVEGTTGFSFDPTSVDDLTEKLRILGADRELRLRFGHAAREHAARSFGADQFGQGLWQACQRALGR